MNLSKRSLLCVLTASLGLLVATPRITLAQAGGVEIKSGAKFKAAFRDCVATASQSTVRVLCDGKETALRVVIGANGFVLTKASDLKGKITVKLKDGYVADATWVGHHDGFDLAMLKLESVSMALTPVKWSDSKVAPVGNFVASVGTGTDPVAVGVVSVAARKLPKGPPTPVTGSGYLGIGLDDVPTGVRVAAVNPGTAAARAKIKEGDVITAIGEREIRDSEALIRIISKFKAGESVQVKLRRGDEQLELKVTLGKRPPERADLQNNMGSKLSNRRSGFPVILQHDSVVLPEDCGGPLCDVDGHVIGINIARVGRVETFAIPSEAIRPLLTDLMSGKLAPPKDY